MAGERHAMCESAFTGLHGVHFFHEARMGQK
jgi:hypothetical protein